MKINAFSWLFLLVFCWSAVGSEDIYLLPEGNGPCIWDTGNYHNCDRDSIDVICQELAPDGTPIGIECNDGFVRGFNTTIPEQLFANGGGDFSSADFDTIPCYLSGKCRTMSVGDDVYCLPYTPSTVTTWYVSFSYATYCD